MRILVTDASYKHSLGIVRSLAEQGHEVYTCSDARLAMAGHSRFVSRHLVVPAPTAPGFVDALLPELERLKVDLLLPVGYQSCKAVAEASERLRDVVKLVLAELVDIVRAADKLEMSRLAERIGVNTPATFSPESLEEVKSNVAMPVPPIVIKARHEGDSLRPRYVTDAADIIPTYRTALAEAAATNAAEPILQSRIAGQGYGFFALYDHGEMKAYFQHKRIREFPVQGGPSTCAESVFEPKLLESGKRLLDELKWHGVAMVEFKRGRDDGPFYLLEINPKFWGSLDLALSCGVNFPQLICNMLSGKSLPEAGGYERGVRYHWPFSGDFRGCWRPSRLAGAAMDCIKPSVRSNLRISDFKPHIIELLQTFSPRFLKRVLR